MIKAVIFDLDGTLVDSEPLHKVTRDNLLKKLGLFSEELSKNAVGISKRDFWAEVSKANGLKLDGNELTVEEFKDLLDLVVERNVKLTVGAVKLLEYLKSKGIKMAVASSSDEFYVNGVLKFVGIREYFDAVCGGDMVEKAKPFPDVYLKALKLLNASAKETLGVEDSNTGMKAVNNAGLTCIGCSANAVNVCGDYSSCYAVVDDLSKIIEIIKNLNNN